MSLVCTESECAVGYSIGDAARSLISAMMDVATIKDFSAHVGRAEAQAYISHLCASSALYITSPRGQRSVYLVFIHLYGFDGFVYTLDNTNACNVLKGMHFPLKSTILSFLTSFLVSISFCSLS